MAQPATPVGRFLKRARLAVQQPLEYAAMLLVQLTGSLLPIAWASAIGGALARTVGPLTGRSRRARRALAQAFPERTAAEVAAIERDMWENLGRTIFEYAKLAPLRPQPRESAGAGARAVIDGAAAIAALRDDGRPGLVFSAHYGNWELVTAAVRGQGIHPLHLIYRPANNPLIDAHVRRLQRGNDVTLHAKGAQGARGLLGAMQAGAHAIMLVDQRMNDGIAVPFLGRPAMTAPAVAQLALKYGAPLLPVRAERLRDARGRFTCRFRIVAEPAIAAVATGDRAGDVAATMALINGAIERWVRADPAQWLWIHNRWGN